MKTSSQSMQAFGQTTTVPRSTQRHPPPPHPPQPMVLIPMASSCTPCFAPALPRPAEGGAINPPPGPQAHGSWLMAHGSWPGHASRGTPRRPAPGTPALDAGAPPNPSTRLSVVPALLLGPWPSPAGPTARAHGPWPRACKPRHAQAPGTLAHDAKGPTTPWRRAAGLNRLNSTPAAHAGPYQVPRVKG